MATEKKPEHDELIHIGPEMAVAEADLMPGEVGRFVQGTSLWRDAWRRLLKKSSRSLVERKIGWR